MGRLKWTDHVSMLEGAQGRGALKWAASQPAQATYVIDNSMNQHCWPHFIGYDGSSGLKSQHTTSTSSTPSNPSILGVWSPWD